MKFLVNFNRLISGFFVFMTVELPKKNQKVDRFWPKARHSRYNRVDMPQDSIVEKRPPASPKIVFITAEHEDHIKSFPRGDQPEIYGTWIAERMGVPIELLKIVHAYNKKEMDALSQKHGLDGINGMILAGSGESVNANLDWQLRYEDFLKKVMPTGMPILGICYGWETVAKALGGRVGFNSNMQGHEYVREFGVEENRLTEEGKQHPIFAGLGPTYKVYTSHEEEVLEPMPEGVRVLARGSGNTVEAVSIEGTNFIGFQHHLELTNEIIHHLDKRGQRFDNIGKRDRRHPDHLRQEVDIYHDEIAATGRKIFDNFQGIMEKYAEEKQQKEEVSFPAVL